MPPAARDSFSLSVPPLSSPCRNGVELDNKLPGQAPLAAPGNFLETQNLRPHSRPMGPDPTFYHPYVVHEHIIVWEALGRVPISSALSVVSGWDQPLTSRGHCREGFHLDLGAAPVWRLSLLCPLPPRPTLASPLTSGILGYSSTLAGLCQQTGTGSPLLHREAGRQDSARKHQATPARFPAHLHLSAGLVTGSG